MSKVKDIFASHGCIINKRLSLMSDNFKRIPRFVSDYLISQLVREDNPSDGIRKIDLLLREHYFESDEKDVIKSRIQKYGTYTLIGQIRARFDQNNKQYWCDIPALGDGNVRIDNRILDIYGDFLFLGGGLWGRIDIAFDPSFKMKSRHYPFFVHNFTPMQITKIDIDHWINSRKYFSKDEWIGLLLNTIGLNPDKFDDQEKMLHICRLIPFIQSNVHMIELGPTETAKTYSYRNLSPYSHVISGSNTTVASLFYNKLRRSIGLIGYKDVIAFDEITTDNIKFSPDLVNMLKDALNSGKFTRDNMEFTTDASVCFVGNIECNRETKSLSGYRSHILSGMPCSIRTDRAFIDRITGIIPGWKFSKVSKDNFSVDYGFMNDYFSRIMHDMRHRNYSGAIIDRIKFSGSSYRNQTHVMSLVSGLLKLIHPNCLDEEIVREDMSECLEIAKMLRCNVIKELNAISPHEFPNTDINADII